jgi:hypothetical protein
LLFIKSWRKKFECNFRYLGTKGIAKADDQC